MPNQNFDGSENLLAKALAPFKHNDAAIDLHDALLCVVCEHITARFVHHPVDHCGRCGSRSVIPLEPILNRGVGMTAIERMEREEKQKQQSLVKQSH